MKIKSIFLYSFFFISVVSFFLFFLFPQKKAAIFLSQSLKNSDVSVSIDRVRPVHPFKFYLENTKVFIGKTTQIVPDSFEVVFGPTVLFKPEKPVSFHSELYQGSLNGSLIVKHMDPLSISHATASLSDIKIRDVRYKTDFTDIRLGCELSGIYHQLEPWTKSSGRGTLLIKNFSAIINTSLFNGLNLPALDFIEMNLDFTHAFRRVTITRCRAKGSTINVTLRGDIDIVLPLQKTRLNLTGTLLPDSPYLADAANKASIPFLSADTSKDGIKFSINGVLGNPKIRI